MSLKHCPEVLIAMLLQNNTLLKSVLNLRGSRCALNLKIHKLQRCVIIKTY